MQQDLSGNDLSRNKIYLICYSVRIGSMDGVEPKRSSIVSNGSVRRPALSLTNNGSTNGNENSPQMRRPFGVAAICLTPLIKKPEDFKNNLDLPFILCEKENLDNTLRKLILNKDVAKMDSKLAVSVELLHCDTKQVCLK